MSNGVIDGLKEVGAKRVAVATAYNHEVNDRLRAFLIEHELEPIVLALGAWGFKALGDPREEQIITPDSMTIDLRTAFRPQVAAHLPEGVDVQILGPDAIDGMLPPGAVHQGLAVRASPIEPLC